MARKNRRNLIGIKANGIIVISRSERKGTNGAYYYNCKCECGKIIELSSSHIGRQKSCGCALTKHLRRIGHERILPIEEYGLSRAYSSYRDMALMRKLEFSITKEQLKNTIKLNCHYCGAIPNNRSKNSYTGLFFIYNGIDRKNNKLGYNSENIIPCCKTCNFAKGKTSYEDFIKYIDLLVNYRNNLNRKNLDA